jgi:antitoxin (DNA-binding transcriptional repressor) of toxin-antitoxin stability system
LDRVDRGETITITRRGREVALLTPPARRPEGGMVNAFQRLRGGMSLGGVSLKHAIAEGRP